MGSIYNPALRKLTGVFFILVLAGIFFSLYFLKFIPEQQRDFHHSSFLELKQFESALLERNNAYALAIQSFITSPQGRKDIRKGECKRIDLSVLAKQFTWINYAKVSKPVYFIPKCDSMELCQIRLLKNKLYNSWQIEYAVGTGPNCILAGFQKNLDTLVSELVSSYRDIFDNYLIIRDSHLGDKAATTANQESTDSTDKLHEGEIIFNSGNLSVDYLVNTDSMLRRNDGFSLLNIHSVTLEGNAYKLFLYPVRLGQERVILAGLIGVSRYNQQFKKIPFNLTVLTGILVLFVLINLPVLKIFKLGPYEQVTEMDMRFLIGTYFVGAFVLFFLFSDSLLNRSVREKDQTELKAMSGKIKGNFISEIDSMCVQLEALDTSYYGQLRRDGGAMRDAMIGYNDSGKIDAAVPVAHMDTVFKPKVYPYLNNVFWLNSRGMWVTSWGYKKTFRQLPRLSVGDRSYFRDFVYHKALVLPGSPTYQKPFSIQPTLSRLDGEYDITVVIQSGRARDTTGVVIDEQDSQYLASPWLLGMGAEMKFVCGAVPAPGYNFCIIASNGNVLYDSKPGRALLSNIYKVVNNADDLEACAIYRNAGYFPSMMMRGRQVSAYCSPVPGFPYTLLTYYRVAETDDMQVHLMALSGILMMTILLLMILSAAINEWSAKKNVLLQVPRLHFDWMSPDMLKNSYYRHLSLWMGWLGLTLFGWWIFIELVCPRACAFSLFFVMVLFPFYIALHYFLIRETFKGNAEKEKIFGIWIILPSKALLGFLLVIILGVSFFAMRAGYIWETLIPQLIWLTLIIRSVHRLTPRPAHDTPEKKETDTAEKIAIATLLNRYSIAILTGVTMISLVPALGIFTALYRQETVLDAAFSEMEMTRELNARRVEYNKIYNDQLFPTTVVPISTAHLDSLKFTAGVYTLSGDSIVHQAELDTNRERSHVVAPVYLSIHNFFFPESGMSTSSGCVVADKAGSSWYFFTENDSERKQNRFIDQNAQEGINRDLLGQHQAPENLQSATALLLSGLNSAGIFYDLLFLLGILLFACCAFYLTRSLARKVFLMDFCRFRSSSADAVFTPSYLHENAGSPGLSPLLPHFKTIHALDIYHYELLNLEAGREDKVAEIGKLLDNAYRKAWLDLNAQEKFMLFDFASDGFTNYKNGIVLRGLMRKGFLMFEHYRLRMVTLSFREFVLHRVHDQEIVSLSGRARNEDSWKNIKIPLLVILAVIGIFIYFTQDLIYQKIAGLFTSLTTIVPLVATLLGGKNNDRDDAKTSPAGD